MEFLKDVRGKGSVPAGGSVSAYTCCLGINLMLKALRSEMVQKQEEAEHESNFQVFRRSIERLERDFSDFVCQDGLAYASYSKFVKIGDSRLKNESLSNILTISMDMVTRAMEVFDWAGRLNGVLSDSFKPHLLVSAELVNGAARATLHVCRSNVMQISDELKRKIYLDKIAMVQEEAAFRYTKALSLLTD
ncbi:MAG: cyclodeaminase/cyclohydrolase family protein [Desulfobacteraceae bacterium]|nr:cyclodeaminase/cyclohydrolase family protein [Desulfobacteraceae bacterium]